MMEDLREKSDYGDEENLTIGEKVAVHTQDEGYAVTKDLFEDRLNDDWYTGTPDDDDDLDCLVEYLELHTHNGFIDTEDEAYKERMCKLLGMTYKKPPSVIIKKFEITRYTIGPGERYLKIKFVEIDKMPRTISNIAMIRTRLMEEMDAKGSGPRAT
ncbi:hypothetical protein Tco_0136135 [Tanacetum coccineum]